MPLDMEALLRNALAEVERTKATDATDARFKALEERGNVTTSDILSALEKATDDELAALRNGVLGPLVKEVEDERDDDADDDATPPAPKPRKRRRPGRRSGAAYDWTVDDEGNVQKLKMARVYTGDDEDDEVELPTRDAEGDDE